VTLTLRPVELTDADAFRSAHAALQASDGALFGLFFDPDEPFERFVERQRKFATGTDLPIAVVESVIVGRVSIRHELNDVLATEGGHIGYAVLAPHRRRGYATEILRQSLTLARSLSIEVARLFCQDDNLGSATVIERCEGHSGATTSGWFDGFEQSRLINRPQLARTTKPQ